jgi:hypothetical protein
VPGIDFLVWGSSFRFLDFDVGPKNDNDPVGNANALYCDKTKIPKGY